MLALRIIVHLLLGVPLYDRFGPCHGPIEALRLFCGMTSLEQIGVIAVCFIIVQSIGELGKLAWRNVKRSPTIRSPGGPENVA